MLTRRSFLLSLVMAPAIKRIAAAPPRLTPEQLRYLEKIMRFGKFYGIGPEKLQYLIRQSVS